MDDFSPYRSPQSYSVPQKPVGPMGKPAAVTWFKVYAGLMLALYVLCAVAGAVLLSFSTEISNSAEEAAELRMMGVIYGVMGVGLAIVFVIGLFVPRRGWGWVYSIVLICLGLTSCCTLPACIPLLIFWIKPETKIYFNMSG